jgi:hypothetical protein
MIPEAADLRKGEDPRNRGRKRAPDKAKDDSEKPRVEEKETSDQKTPRFKPAVALYQRPTECAFITATYEIGRGPGIVKPQ